MGLQIFAKRTRKVVVKAKEDVDKSPTRKTFASDPVVEELLKKDPSEWNAKEKRMVKRYQTRMDELKNEKEEESNKKEDTEEEENNNIPKSEAAETQKVDEKALDLSTVLEPNILETLNSKQRRKLSRTLVQQGQSAVEQVVQEATQMAKGTEKSGEDKSNNEIKEEVEKVAEKRGSDEMEQVKDLLKGLNSKQKRKLSRRLEREGEECLAEVKAEAEELLKGSSAAAESNKSEKDATNLSGKKRKRRRGGAADWSGLTPEERLRREEQRKMQKEAAERRDNGEESTEFKHPLNSERRRANRRKPKWAPKRAFANEHKIEHNSSGFQVRKFKKDG